MIQDKKIVAVVIAFKPDMDQLIHNLTILQEEKCFVCLVNNSPYPIAIESFQGKIFNLLRNEGIAEAQNIGMEWAFSSGADFVLQLDQDSTPEKGMVEQLISSYYSLIDNGFAVGLIGPQDYDSNSGKPSQAKINKGRIIHRNNLLSVTETLSSGSLIPKETYFKLGGMESKLFIDMVDFEYCWRLRANNLLVIKDTEAKLFHRLGEGKQKIWGLVEVGIPAPFRHYYAVRNTVYIILYREAPFYWKISNFGKVCFKLIVYPFVLSEGLIRLKYITQGLVDGVRKKFRIINA